MNSMEKVRKRFVLYAVLAIFVLLTVLLTIINGVIFTMAGEDADQITLRLSENHGTFRAPEDIPLTAPDGTPEETPPELPEGIPEAAPPDSMSSDTSTPPGNGPGRRGPGPRIGPMGPGSPEMESSLRYFTYAFDRAGNARQAAFAISAVSEEDAENWADSLRSRQQIGWTRTTYRYRVYHSGGEDFVTVIDQGRELLSAFRILAISVSAELLGLLVSYLVLRSVSKRLFKPLLEADRKQKRFIAEAEKEFRVPLTIIHAGTEVLEQERGESEQTRVIHRQVKRMETLVRDLSALSVFDEADLERTALPLSDFANAAADDWREKFAEKGIALKTEIADQISIQGDGEAVTALLEELLENAWKFGRTRAGLTVRKEGERVLLAAENDTELSAGSADQVFDRFTRLDNAKDAPGAGLGLSRLREIVQAHNGRVNAKVADGVFTVTVSL